MKNYIIILILILVSCNKNSSQNIEPQKIVIKNFINNVVIQTKSNYESILKLTESYNEGYSQYSQIQIGEEGKKLYLKSFEKDSIQKYIDYTESKNSDALYTINFRTLALKETIEKEKWKNFKITHYSEIKENDIIKKSDIFKKMETSYLDNLYFVIFDENPDRVLFFIIENEKIISFFSNVFRTSKGDPLIPKILNNQD